MSTSENQEAEPQDVSRFQAFVRSAARAPGMRPGRTWLTTTTAGFPAIPRPRGPHRRPAGAAFRPRSRVTAPQDIP